MVKKVWINHACPIQLDLSPKNIVLANGRVIRTTHVSCQLYLRDRLYYLHCIDLIMSSSQTYPCLFTATITKGKDISEYGH